MNEEPKLNGIKRDEEGKILDGSAPLNPAGRPKDSLSLIGILKQKLRELGKDKEGHELAKTNAELLIERIVGEAIAKGNDQQIKNILQYLEGMQKQPIEHSGEMVIPILLDKEEHESLLRNNSNKENKETD